MLQGLAYYLCIFHVTSHTCTCMLFPCHPCYHTARTGFTQSWKVRKSHVKMCGHGKSLKITKIRKVMEKYKFSPNSRSKYSKRCVSFQVCPVMNFPWKNWQESQPWIARIGHGKWLKSHGISSSRFRRNPAGWYLEDSGTCTLFLCHSCWHPCQEDM